MSDDWNDYADGWDGNSDVRTYAARAFAALDAYAGITGGGWQDKRVLDFGCGTGLLSEKLAPHVQDVAAVDTSDRMIAVLQEKALPNVRALHLDILDSSGQGAGEGLSGFDLICASSVCGFLPDYKSAVAALAGRLNSGGLFVQWDWLAPEQGGSGLTEQQVRDALRDAGFESIRVEHAFTMDAGGQAMPVLMGSGVRAAE
ncbi:class I SAM-dependent DNA methyltransferase [Leisingera aquaemixtae]|uniref:class I SAM-dependent DNA methyltransferase n=1 Tax=Leisingera aquaemixtae TaxID=1396826 RepID=UPI0021A7D822|nr:class I SAM-dependent methyltransferase [Leisingera aquaemixtae]UWQ46590.1 class I SAM-dependent methyltransferase [Leisingera aquaemixtae]